MEIKVIEKSKNKFIFEVEGEDHALMNALRHELNQDSAVKSAGYNISHPLTASPRMVVETTSAKTPAKAIQEAIKRLRKANEKLGKDTKKF